MSGKTCGHGPTERVSYDESCGQCRDYARMYRLDHKTAPTKAEDRELAKLTRKFS